MGHMTTVEMMCVRNLLRLGRFTGPSYDLSWLPAAALSLPGVAAGLCWLLRGSYVSLLEGLPDGAYVFPEDLKSIADILLEEYTAREICSYLYL